MFVVVEVVVAVVELVNVMVALTVLVTVTAPSPGDSIPPAKGTRSTSRNSCSYDPTLTTVVYVSKPSSSILTSAPNGSPGAYT